MTRFLWRMGGALAVCVLGMTMMFWALERSSLVGFEAELTGVPQRAPFSTYVTLFLGLVLLNLAVFYALTQWSEFLRAHPDTPQAPLWLLFTIAAVSAAALITAMATHAGWIRSLEQVPLDVNAGYIAFQVVTGALAVICLVLIGVRWAPGYKHRLHQS